MGHFEQRDHSQLNAEEKQMAVDFHINGKAVRCEAPADTPLLWGVREQLKLTGTKFGCGAGLCGACTVHIDGERAFSCQTQISDVGGRDDQIRVFLTVVETEVSSPPSSRLMPVSHGFALERCSGRRARTATAARLGQETTLFSIITNLLHFGMVFVGLDYGHAGQMTLDEITGGSPYGATTIAGGDGSCQPTANELQGARYQGRKIAETAHKLHG
jgi:ferredoxin